MRSTRLFRGSCSLALLAGIAVGGCTIITPGGNDGSQVVPVPIPLGDALPPPPPLEANVLFVVNLHRSSANLAQHYAGVILGLGAALEARNQLKIQSYAVAPTYADAFGPRLLLGHTESETVPRVSLAQALLAAAAAGATDYITMMPFIREALANIEDTDLAHALQLMAASGAFDGAGETCEAKNVIEIGRGLSSSALPPGMGGVERSAFFDQPRDLFLVVYLQPLRRRCELGSAECTVDGRSPADIFLEADAEGGATWLAFTGGRIPLRRVVHASIATAEGQSLSDFRAACARVPGFPQNLFDVMEPSPNAYFGPLMNALNAANDGTGQQGDLCTLIGSDPELQMLTLGGAIASRAGQAQN